MFLSKDITFTEKLYSYEPIISMSVKPDDVAAGSEKEAGAESDEGGSSRPPWISGEHYGTDGDSDADEAEECSEKPAGVTKTRSGRTVSPPKRFANLAFVTAEAMLGNVSDDVPSTASNAMSVGNKKKWVKAMSDEMISLSENETFDVDCIPDGKKVVRCGWVFALKRNASGDVYRRKARLVAKGYSQVKRVDYFEVFSPVVRFETLCFQVAQVARYDLELYQVDLKTAFLYGNLDEDIWMEVLDLSNEVINAIESGIKKHAQLHKLCEAGVRSDDKFALKLRKSLYGLNQASLKWH